MRDLVKKKCDELIVNREKISKNFFGEFGIMECGAGLIMICVASNSSN